MHLLAVTPAPMDTPSPSRDGCLSIKPGTVKCFDWGMQQLFCESLKSCLTRESQLMQFCLKGFSSHTARRKGVFCCKGQRNIPLSWIFSIKINVCVCVCACAFVHVCVDKNMCIHMEKRLRKIPSNCYQCPQLGKEIGKSTQKYF